MEKQNKRTLLLIGLILNVVSYAILAISCIISIFALASVATEDSVKNSSVFALAMAVYILIFLLALAGTIVSSISFTRLSLPTAEFNKKRGIIIASFVIDIISIIMILIGLTSTFNVLSLIFMLVLIAGCVLIIIEFAKSLNSNNTAISENIQNPNDEIEVISENNLNNSNKESENNDESK